MIDIFVQRHAGDKRGEDIVDPLIGSIPVAIERGRNELDERSSGMQQVELDAVFRTDVELGMLGKFYDSQVGEIWYGKVVGITHAYSASDDGVFTVTTRLQIQRPTIGI